ncbi:MAG: hypothetical protein ACJAYV_000668 [Oleispira sp.]|jgi:hypothetical protein
MFELSNHGDFQIKVSGNVICAMLYVVHKSSRGRNMVSSIRFFLDAAHP